VTRLTDDGLNVRPARTAQDRVSRPTPAPAPEPRATVADVLDAVDAGEEDAADALAAEQASDEPRSTLVEGLERRLPDDDDE
jgi:hypothetical protein